MTWRGRKYYTLRFVMAMQLAWLFFLDTLGACIRESGLWVYRQSHSRSFSNSRPMDLKRENKKQGAQLTPSVILRNYLPLQYFLKKRGRLRIILDIQ